MKQGSMVVWIGVTLAGSVWGFDVPARFNLSLERVLHGGPPRFTRDFVVADALPRHVRRFTEFSGDVSGRYLEALAVAEGYTGQSYPEIRSVLEVVAAAQKPGGFFGDAFPEGPITRKHMALLWGNGRMLIGLMTVHARHGDALSLATARKLGDFLVSVAPRLNDPAVARAFSGDQHAVGYICWTQCTEGLVALYRATGDRRYLDTAAAAAQRMVLHEGQHSHGFLTTLRGMLDLHEVTGDRGWLTRVVDLRQRMIAAGNLLPHGCVPEAFAPRILRDEGCTEADWVRLNLRLWQVTAEPAYLDAAEYAVFNEFALNQFHTGDFGHRTVGARGVGGAINSAKPGPEGQFSAVRILYGQARAWWCCTFHGLRALPAIAEAAFRVDEDTETLYYDLPVSATWTRERTRVEAVSSLGQDGTCRLRAVAVEPGVYRLALRCPDWATSLAVAVNDTPVETRAEGLYRVVTRTWSAGDRVTLRYRLRFVTRPHPRHAGWIGFQYGPWMLGVERSGSPAFFDEPSSLNRLRRADLPAAGQVPPRRAVRETGGETLTAPRAHFALRFVPGGYPIQPQEAWLRPLADQTALPEANEWIFWFPVQD